VSVVFDPLLREFRADPYPTYDHLRREEPVRWCPLDGGFWVVTRYDDVAGARLTRRRRAPLLRRQEAFLDRRAARRLEAEIASRFLVARLWQPELETVKREWRDSYLNHALERLPIRFSAVGA
jgi:hypothetical protein